jgi:HSP20 family protein
VDRPPRRSQLLSFPERLHGDRWEPSLDVVETEKSVVLRVELAGVKSDEVRVTVDGDVVRVRGLRRAPGAADALRLHQMEIAYGLFERSVRVGIPFEREEVSATLEEGFLTVTLPKRAPTRRRIAVRTEPSEDEERR